MTERTRTTFKVTVAGRRVVDFSTLRKGDKFILQDDGPLIVEKGDVCNVAMSDAYLRGGIWTIDCEEIEGSPVKRVPIVEPEDISLDALLEAEDKKFFAEMEEAMEGLDTMEQDDG